MSSKGPKRQKRFLQDWGSLQELILELILESLPSIHDYIRFGLICKHWRNVALDHKLQRLKTSHKQLAPLMLLRPINTNGNQMRLDLYNVTKRKVVHSFNLPNFEKYHILLCGSSHGWLAYTDNAGLTLTLINPFTKDSIKLPKLIPEAVETSLGYFISRFVLSANPSFFPNEYEVLVTFEDWIPGGDRELAHFKSGDDAWTYCDKQLMEDLVIIDAAYHKGRFVVLNDRYGSRINDGTFLRVHLSIECISEPEGDDVLFNDWAVYGKSTCQDLLAVNTSRKYKEKRARVLKLASSTGDGSFEWKEVTSFGSDVFFWDDIASTVTCSSALESGCLPNMMYTFEVAFNLSGEERSNIIPIPEQTRPKTWITPTLSFSI